MVKMWNFDCETQSSPLLLQSSFMCAKSLAVKRKSFASALLKMRHGTVSASLFKILKSQL